MAFMMPVVKNEWDIYKTNRSRRSSECSNPQACRSRKKNVILTSDYMLKRLGVFKVGGPILVDIPGLGLSHVTRPPFDTPQQPSLLAHLLPCLPELPPVPQQKYRLFTPKNRQFQFPQQVSQSSSGQAQTFIEEGRGQWRRSAQSIVKQPGGFGPSTSVRFETNRHKTHLGAPDDVTQRLVVRQQQCR